LRSSSTTSTVAAIAVTYLSRSVRRRADGPDTS
jgi:hypothetical protein